MTVRILRGDASAMLQTLPPDSMQACVTSPPYYGLRDYGTATWDGGDAGCDHLAPLGGGFLAAGLGDRPEIAADKVVRRRQQYRDTCGKCGARRVDQQIGLEQSPDEYVAALTGVFREVRRVLHPSGVVLLNLGDSYATGTTAPRKPTSIVGPDVPASWAGRSQPERVGTPYGYKTKDLLGMPWAVAFALRADGWWLRSAIVWAKPNPMPESVTDRPTSSYEHVFLLARSQFYFWDAEAVAEIRSDDAIEHTTRYANSERTTLKTNISRKDGGLSVGTAGFVTGATRNARNVLTIASEPFPEAHFATMPPSLAEWCVRAATSERGCCPHCRAPWERVTERESRPNAPSLCGKYNGQGVHRTISGGVSNDARERRDAGWRPTCACPQHEPIACTALDPFAGAGTTLLAADRLRRDAIGIELNPAYAVMAERRVRADAPLFAPVGGADTPLFSRAADDAYDAPMRDLFAA